MLKCNKVKSSREGGEKGTGKIIDFDFWPVSVVVGCEEDGVIDTVVSCEDVCRMMDRCHLQSNKQAV